MDLLSIIGLSLALVAIIGGSIAKGSGIGALWNAAALIIVMVGTLAAIMLQTPLKVFMHALRLVPWLIKPPKLDPAAVVDKIVGWSNIARKEGLLGLEALVEQETDPFSQKGLQLLVDGSEPEVIRNILEVELASREDFDIRAAKVFEGMGIYAPTLGIIGAVMGLMAVMQNLADPSKLGPGIAAAFVATIYGIASANLLFLPMANKLKTHVHNQSQFRAMIIDGIISIAEGENPRNIETKLKSYLS